MAETRCTLAPPQPPLLLQTVVWCGVWRCVVVCGGGVVGCGGGIVGCGKGAVVTEGEP